MWEKFWWFLLWPVGFYYINLCFVKTQRIGVVFSKLAIFCCQIWLKIAYSMVDKILSIFFDSLILPSLMLSFQIQLHFSLYVIDKYQITVIWVHRFWQASQKNAKYSSFCTESTISHDEVTEIIKKTCQLLQNKKIWLVKNKH